MSERADDKTIQFGALANPDALGADAAAVARAEAETVELGALSAPQPVAAPKQAPAQTTVLATQSAPPSSASSGKRRSTGFVMIAAAVAVAVVGGVAAVLLLGGGTQPASDQQQVEAAIRTYYDVVRDKGLAAASAMSCKAIRDASTSMPDGAGNVDFKQDITINKIENIKITGDSATAEVTGHAQSIVGGQTEADETDKTTLTLTREDGHWRYCTMQE